MVKSGTMDFIDKKLSKKEILDCQEKYGDYIKLTIDTEKGWIVSGCVLHADGEKILLGKGSKQADIWGGGINFLDKQIDTTAVLNIRPSQNNDSMEILDSEARSKFVGIAKDYFSLLWK